MSYQIALRLYARRYGRHVFWTIPGDCKGEYRVQMFAFLINAASTICG